MSQSRFSIVLVGVSALLRRPLVSRLRPAVFAARGSGGFRRSALPSASELPLGELVLLPSVSEIATRRVGLRAHGFRFSARTASELPLGELVLPPSVSEIAARRVGLRAHDFRFSARTASGLPSSGWRFRSAGWPSGSPLPLFGMRRFGVALGELAFGLTTSAFRHAPLRGYPRRVGSSARRVGLRAHGFRFSACAASGLPSAGWFCRLPFRRLPLGGLVFGLTASAFRYAPLRGCRSAGWFFCLPLRRLPLVRLVLPQGELAFGLTASAFRHAPLRSGRWASSFFRLPLRKLPLAG